MSWNVFETSYTWYICGNIRVFSFFVSCLCAHPWSWEKTDKGEAGYFGPLRLQQSWPKTFSNVSHGNICLTMSEEKYTFFFCSIWCFQTVVMGSLYMYSSYTVWSVYFYIFILQKSSCDISRHANLFAKPRIESQPQCVLAVKTEKLPVWEKWVVKTFILEVKLRLVMVHQSSNASSLKNVYFVPTSSFSLKPWWCSWWTSSPTLHWQEAWI